MVKKKLNSVSCESIKFENFSVVKVKNKAAKRILYQKFHHNTLCLDEFFSKIKKINNFLDFDHIIKTIFGKHFLAKFQIYLLSQSVKQHQKYPAFNVKVEI